MSAQQKLQDRLSNAGIPHKEVHCYGSQIMVTCWGREAAEKFNTLLHGFCETVRGPWEATDDNLENKNTVLKPSHHKVWRVWGTV